MRAAGVAANKNAREEKRFKDTGKGVAPAKCGHHATTNGSRKSRRMRPSLSMPCHQLTLKPGKLRSLCVPQHVSSNEEEPTHTPQRKACTSAEVVSRSSRQNTCLTCKKIERRGLARLLKHQGSGKVLPLIWTRTLRNNFSRVCSVKLDARSPTFYWSGDVEPTMEVLQKESLGEGRQPIAQLLP